MLSCPLCSSDLPTEPLLLQHIRVCHSWDPNFSIQCIVRGCCRTFGNYRTFQNHLLKHGSHTTVPVTTQECISIDNVEAADTVPLNTQSTIANLEAVASTINSLVCTFHMSLKFTLVFFVIISPLCDCNQLQPFNAQFKKCNFDM